MSPERRATFLDATLIVVATSLTFARSLGASLLSSWDDNRFLLEFAPVQEISWANFVTLVSEPHFEAYHPLHLLSYWIDVPLFGLDPVAIHGTSLVLWVGAALLLWRVMRGLELGRAGAIVATLAFALHPVQVEAVTWASGRKEIIALLFVCLSTLAHLRSEGPNDRFAWASRATFILATLAKTTALPLPIVLLLIDVLLRDRSWKRALVQQLPATLLALGSSALVLHLWSDNDMVRAVPPGALARVALVGATLTHDAQTIFAPLWNSPLYAIHRTADSLGALYLLPLAALGLAAALLRKHSRALFVLLATTAWLLPVLNIVPLYFEVQDRYLCLPLLPLAFGLGSLLGRAPSIYSIAYAGVFVFLLAARTMVYQGAWQDDEALWSHATAEEPQAYYAWMKLAEVQRNAGDFEGAIESYSAGIDAHPTIRLGHASRLHVMALRDEREHELHPSRALRIAARFHQAADDSSALRDLASDMVAWGYRDAALLPLGRSLELSPLEDGTLERAALRRAATHPWLARFYISRMSRDPVEPALIRFIDPLTVDGDGPRRPAREREADEPATRDLQPEDPTRVAPPE